MSITLAAWLLQARIESLLDSAYTKIVGARPPHAVSLLLASLEAGALGLVAGFIVRSPLTGTLASLSILDGGKPVDALWPPLAAAGIAGGMLAALASLLGGPLESLKGNAGRRDGLSLAIAASSILAASTLGMPCGPYRAVGALAAAASAYLLGYPEALLTASLAGLGWLGAFVGVTVASLRALPPPSCGGLRVRVDSILSRAPISRLAIAPHSLWAAWGFECAEGEGTVIPEGHRGSVLVAYGPEARAAAGYVASRIGGGVVVVCISCDAEYWRSLGFTEADFTIGGEPPIVEPPTLLVVKAERPWDYALTAVATLTSAGEYSTIIMDRADLVRGIRVLEAIVDEALDSSRLVVLVEPEPSRAPLLPTVAGASHVVAIAGPVPDRYIRELLPLGSSQAVEAVYEALRRGYVIFYPTCKGGVAAVRARRGQ